MNLSTVQDPTFDSKLPLLRFLKQNNQDFEWYPTTEEMLNCIKADLKQRFQDRFEDKQPSVSVLDCGAGDGRALEAIANHGKKYAIEKSERLIFEMSNDIYVVGTEFHENTLIDKKAEVVFSNPPYSEYQHWASKIIREANSALVYLIIPKRWVESALINDALKARDVEATIIGTFDFHNAERHARAVVDILSINLSTEKQRHYSRNREPLVDPFIVWFDTYFSINAEKTETDLYYDEKRGKATLLEKVDQQLVAGKNLIQALVELYNMEMQHLIENYQAVGRLDSTILKELGVSVSGLREGLKQKISNLKSKYWHEFFNNYKQLTERLTNASRKAMLDKLQENISIDFTQSNALALTVWAIKNANQYFDTQLVEIFQSMLSEANISLYKSNLRTWGVEDWRYCRNSGPKDLSHYGLELRIVLHRYHAIEGGGYGYSFEYKNGLHETAHTFIEDLITVAGNLGFSVVSDSHLRQWQSNKAQIFWADDSELMHIKAFKNGNLHIKFNQLFIRKLNVEFGRLRGWLKSKEHAADELNIPVEEIDGIFNSNHQICQSMVPQICFNTTV